VAGWLLWPYAGVPGPLQRDAPRPHVEPIRGLREMQKRMIHVVPFSSLGGGPWRPRTPSRSEALLWLPLAAPVGAVAPRRAARRLVRHGPAGDRRGGRAGPRAEPRQRLDGRPLRRGRRARRRVDRRLAARRRPGGGGGGPGEAPRRAHGTGSAGRVLRVDRRPAGGFWYPYRFAYRLHDHPLAASPCWRPCPSRRTGWLGVRRVHRAPAEALPLRPAGRAPRDRVGPGPRPRSRDARARRRLDRGRRAPSPSWSRSGRCSCRARRPIPRTF